MDTGRRRRAGTAPRTPEGGKRVQKRPADGVDDDKRRGGRRERVEAGGEGREGLAWRIRK
jgi:hypothetical protein